MLNREGAKTAKSRLGVLFAQPWRPLRLCGSNARTITPSPPFPAVRHSSFSGLDTDAGVVISRQA